MKFLVVAGLVLLIAAPAFAEEKTTLQYMLANGVALHADRSGEVIDSPITYKADGTSLAVINGQQLPGKWRVDGDKFCVSNAVNPAENCFALPPGKKPGDSFKVMTPALGEVTLTINK